MRFKTRAKEKGPRMGSCRQRGSDSRTDATGGPAGQPSRRQTTLRRKAVAQALQILRKPLPPTRNRQIHQAHLSGCILCETLRLFRDEATTLDALAKREPSPFLGAKVVHALLASHKKGPAAAERALSLRLCRAHHFPMSAAYSKRRRLINWTS